MGPRTELSNTVEILYKIMINAAYARAATFCMIKRANLTSDFTVSPFGRLENSVAFGKNFISLFQSVR